MNDENRIDRYRRRIKLAAAVAGLVGALVGGAAGTAVAEFDDDTCTEQDDD